MNDVRPIYEIAREITRTWPQMSYAAKPYHEAMLFLTDINDTYYADSAKSIVRYFLSNASSWRGDHARRIKAELKDLLKTS